MTFSNIRRSLGIGWFCLLVVLTAGIIVASDHEIGSLQSALSTHLASTFVVSIPAGLVAIGPFILFRRQQWLLGVAITPLVGLVFHSLLCALQTPACYSTLSAFLAMVPKVAGIVGGWLILISLPPALLLNRR
ncbi:MAG: hypothetical protein AAF773_02330 [Cyanobacteria bacterium P01_D01_bin.115]